MGLSIAYANDLSEIFFTKGLFSRNPVVTHIYYMVSAIANSAFNHAYRMGAAITP